MLTAEQYDLSGLLFESSITVKSKCADLNYSLNFSAVCRNETEMLEECSLREVYTIPEAGLEDSSEYICLARNNPHKPMGRAMQRVALI